MPKRIAFDESWKPDRHSTCPLHKQIVTRIKEMITAGDLPVGTRLPPQRDLAKLFNVNRSTVVAAMEELAALGVVEGRGSAGTVIADDTWSLLLPGRGTWRERITAGALQASTSIVQAINIHEFDEGVIRLGTSEVDPRFFPRDAWRHALVNAADDPRSFGYLEPLGSPELRAKLAERLMRRGISANPSEILITSGSLQGLQLIAACLLEPGTLMLVEEPTYACSLQVFPSAGMTLAGVDMDDEGMSVQALERALPERTRTPRALYTIPTNHNPTGVTMSEQRREKIMELCQRRGVPVIEDDAYGELCLDDPPLAPLKARDERGSVIYLGTASKSFAAGLRVGWMIASRAVVERLGDAKMQSDYGASSVSQVALTQLISSGDYDRYLQDLLAELRTRRRVALSALEYHFADLATWRRPTGGFFIWTTFRHPVPTAELFSKALAAGILLNPGDIYGFKATNSLRLSYSYASSSEFASGIEKLANIVQELI